ncbi:Gfo/Idh/MocA family protein [Cellulosilyticum sp. I15G10I2]|uniref:Gfo/Idh/MocA family protein n=1 Tax=Cellulosilyticum sp. I15G10I2 TaxID=1892843 RepID=UPI00085C1074|nr:Gfo/Idh/MocA family oxidoreductase [Cellulosilyticum sp. I15G10I2]
MNKVRWGIIGAGNISNTFAKAVLTLPRAELAAVAARNLDSAKAFALKYDIPKVYGSYLEMVKDNEIDAVYIATPHSHHYEHMMLCLENGKHVLCEKAFTVNEQLSKKVIDVAKSKKLMLMEAFWTRFLPMTQKIKELIAENSIGEIKAIHTHFGFDLTHLGPKSRVFDLTLAGGALLDVGVYVINSATMYLGNKPDKITCVGKKGQTGADYKNSIILEYGDKIATLSSSIDTRYANKQFIVGTKGMIEVPEFWQCQKAIITEHNKEVYEINLPHGVNGFEYEIGHFMDCLFEGKTESDIMTFENTLAIAKITDACRKQMDLVYPFE